MISFHQGSRCFNFRIVAVVINDEQVLAHRGENEDFWALPGGRVEWMEASPDTLRREMLEELNVTITVERLLWVVENFYSDINNQYHEISFFFYLVPLPQHLYTPFYSDEEGLRLIFEWFPIKSLVEVELYPTFLREALLSLPTTITHIIHTDQS